MHKINHKIGSAKISYIQDVLRDHITTDPERAAYFFKTGEGQYGAGDQFLGVSVPHVRSIAKHFSDADFGVLQELLESEYNEERLIALIILANQYHAAARILAQAKMGQSQEQVQECEKIYNFYTHNLWYVNNWNLVDSSAHLIIGAHLWDKDRAPLLELAQSQNMWERRIAIVATWYFIKQGDLEWTFKIARELLGDTHDLIHKAVGWMLREAGKKDEQALVQFLHKHAGHMPRTMLRYAIEKFGPEVRAQFLAIKRAK
jgi:3-methyladenine DNA glycosylase AlkD